MLLNKPYTMLSNLGLSAKPALGASAGQQFSTVQCIHEQSRDLEVREERAAEVHCRASHQVATSDFVGPARALGNVDDEVDALVSDPGNDSIGG